MPLELLRTNQVLRLDPALRDYAWGDSSTIPRLLGVPSTGRPCAEAWYGAHPRASASAGGAPLCAVVDRDPVGVLGHSVRDRFGGVPYLLKILAARRPLSVQVHPNRAQARAGHAREEAAGIPLTARHRCYPDRRAKAELLVALSPFELLAGVRPLPQIERALAGIPEVATLLPPIAQVGIPAWVKAYLALPAGRLGPALQHWVARDDGLVADMHERLGQPLPDPGLVFAVLLEPMSLQPGEAVFIEPGLLHAYLEGTALEIAGNSDNVVRAGLTVKHVDPAELLDVVQWSGAPVRQALGDASGTFACDADSFRLCRESVIAGVPQRFVANGPETVLALPGQDDVCVRISWREGRMDLRRGHACLVPHGVSYQLEATGNAEVYRAVVPV